MFILLKRKCGYFNNIYKGFNDLRYMAKIQDFMDSKIHKKTIETWLRNQGQIK